MTKRKACDRCKRPTTECYCHLIKNYEISTPILVLQHPRETNHPLGTLRIAQLSLESNITTLIGEDFEEEEVFKNFIKRFSPHLLFPESESIKKSSETIKLTGLIVIDGTWKKSKKIFFKSKTLKALPRLELTPSKESIYTIRKEPKEQYLSTLESIILAVDTIEGKDLNELLKPMQFLIDTQINYMGKEHFDKYYKGKDLGK